MERFPHHFSGGQRQRIAIARALTVNPKVLILDEPVSALDVSIRAQILELLRSMQADTGLTYLFIGHDLATVRYMSHTVAVMYFGRLMEVAPAPVLFRQPLHPYTRRLVALASSRERIGRSRLQGELPDPTKRIAGCAFRSRCPWAQPVCAEQAPALREIAPAHRAACHFAEDIAREAELPAHALQQESSHAERHPDIAAMGRAGAEQYDRRVVP
jgi:oligopeptide/dipeptide ABC transporter ATP-binding protein